ncbi:MAG TPA: CBS domain-containing protein [Candidatus Nitrosopolaris sp.]|nr:CBS domain-containing protein [Candidatus Nitrosopolaris sp.]
MSTVNEIASRKEIVTITAGSGKTAYDVANLMKRNRAGSIIVIDKRGQPLGIITDRDMVKRVCLKNLSSSRIKVEEIMSTPLITVMSYDSIETASRVMTKNKIKRLIILEADNRITGVLSAYDITKHLAEVLLDDHNQYRSLRFAVELS